LTCFVLFYQIGHSIGQGSFAVVFKGRERATGREVAMKIVRAQDQIEFDDGSGGCPDDAYRLTLKSRVFGFEIHSLPPFSLSAVFDKRSDQSSSPRCQSNRDVLEAMRIEANIIASIGSHPNIVQLLGVTADFTGGFFRPPCWQSTFLIDCSLSCFNTRRMLEQRNVVDTLAAVLIMERGLIDIYCLLKKQPVVALSVVKLWMKHLLTAVRHLHDLDIVHQVIRERSLPEIGVWAETLCLQQPQRVRISASGSAEWGLVAVCRTSSRRT
jgi:serine/threonine protein kinase